VCGEGEGRGVLLKGVEQYNNRFIILHIHIFVCISLYISLQANISFKHTIITFS
jgi:hypothetical protein